VAIDSWFMKEINMPAYRTFPEKKGLLQRLDMQIIAYVVPLAQKYSEVFFFSDFH
ncbi:hypothetical protein THOM_2299, partial [Trachipleistophora hominis]